MSWEIKSKQIGRYYVVTEVDKDGVYMTAIYEDDRLWLRNYYASREKALRCYYRYHRRAIQEMGLKGDMV